MSRIEDALNKMETARSNDKPVIITALSKSVDKGHGPIDEHIITYHQPTTAMSENFKQFNTIISAISRNNNSTLAFTSAFKGEGKSVIALNFAVALANDCEGRVCVVDADLRKPTMHRLLGRQNTQGLAEVLEGRLSAGNAVLPTPIENLFFIPAGDAPKNSSELFSSKRAEQVVAELKQTFDYVIFDSAPVLPVADTIHLSALLEGVVMVVLANKTHRKHARRAVELLGNANVLGFILNKSERDRSMKDYD